MARAIISYSLLLFSSFFLCSACISLQPFKVIEPSVSPPAEGSKLNSAFSLIVNQVQLNVLQKRIVFLTLFTPECSPCGQVVQQLNRLVKLKETYSIALYGVCIEPNGCVRLNEFISAYRPAFTLGIIESSFRPTSLEKTLPFESLQAVPITYLLKEDGTLIESFVGSIPMQYVIKQIDQIASNDQKTLADGED